MKYTSLVEPASPTEEDFDAAAVTGTVVEPCRNIGASLADTPRPTAPTRLIRAGHADERCCTPMDVLWMIVIAVGLVLLAWYAFAAEPHWVSKDGQAFTCRLQYLNTNLMPEGRWRDAKAYVDNGFLVVKPRGSVTRRPRTPTHFSVLKQGEDPPRGRVTYLLNTDATGSAGLCVMHIPAKSRAVTHVDALVGR